MARLDCPCPRCRGEGPEDPAVLDDDDRNPCPHCGDIDGDHKRCHLIGEDMTNTPPDLSFFVDGAIESAMQDESRAESRHRFAQLYPSDRAEAQKAHAQRRAAMTMRNPLSVATVELHMVDIGHGIRCPAICVAVAFA